MWRTSDWQSVYPVDSLLQSGSQQSFCPGRLASASSNAGEVHIASLSEVRVGLGEHDPASLSEVRGVVVSV